jgi:hypothetical protein
MFLLKSGNLINYSDRIAPGAVFLIIVYKIATIDRYQLPLVTSFYYLEANAYSARKIQNNTNCCCDLTEPEYSRAVAYKIVVLACNHESFAMAILII